MKTPLLFPKISDLCDHLVNEFDLIPPPRKSKLRLLAKYLSEKLKNDSEANLLVICTHNSRRSHFGQIWIEVARDYWGIQNMHSFSGGTEETEVYPAVIETLEESGFQIERLGSKEELNPTFLLKKNTQEKGTLLYSKIYSHSSNPDQEFGALLVCSNADEGCPVVNGAEFRLVLPFSDPKTHDNSPDKMESYSSSNQEIARELLFALSMVHQK